jgi:putative addiction module antidote
MQTLKISKVGDSLSITLSPEILAKLQVGEGDSIVAIEIADGIKLIADDSERAALAGRAGVEAYSKVVNKYSSALEQLAK